MGLPVGCWVFGHIGIFVCIIVLGLQFLWTAPQVACRIAQKIKWFLWTAAQVAYSIRKKMEFSTIRMQQEAGEMDSSEVEEYLHLGRVAKYKDILSGERPFSKGKDGDKGYVEADHIPPLDSLRRAKKCKGFSKLSSRNPVLHQMVMISLKTTGQKGRDLLTMQVATQHHRTALSTVSSAARGVVAQRIASGDVKTMLKQAMIIAHPFASQMIREDAGRSSTTPEESILFKPTRAMDYYRDTFLRVVDYYFYDQKIILCDEEYEELVEWVRNDGYLYFSSSEYKEILEAVRKKKKKKTEPQ